MSDNKFTGEIPPEIGNCNQLEMVDLHGNALQGIIPSSFEFLVGPNVLDLSMNRLAGTIPENLGKLTSLNKLIISGNQITGLIPSSLGLCRGLQLLDMTYEQQQNHWFYSRRTWSFPRIRYSLESELEFSDRPHSRELL